jgi:release factor glutamine methyltransferase
VTTIEALIASGAKRLAAAGIDTPRTDSRILLAHALGVAANELVGRRELEGAPPAYGPFLARREKREPVAYITGAREFWSLEFEVGPGVLIPRPETETLIEEATNAFPDRVAALQVLDMGTGTACLPVAFLKEYPNARALGVDASREALSWARRNLDKHGLLQRCRLLETQWTDGLDDTFDVIFCNPPYIDTATIGLLEPDVKDFEPLSALDGGPDGLDAYRVIAPRIDSHLKQTGRAFVELGIGQANSVRDIFATQGLETIRVVPDLSGIDRCLVAAKTA